MEMGQLGSLSFIFSPFFHHSSIKIECKNSFEGPTKSSSFFLLYRLDLQILSENVH